MILLLLLFVVLFISCTHDVKTIITLEESPIVAERIPFKGDSLVVADFDKVMQAGTINFPMSKFCEWYELVKLDNSRKDIMIPHTSYFVASDNYLMAQDGGNIILLFDKFGKYLMQIGEKEGPGGYNGFYNSGYIDEINQQIIIPITNGIKIYSLINGQVESFFQPFGGMNLANRQCIPWGYHTYLCSRSPEELNHDVLELIEIDGVHISGFPSKYFHAKSFQPLPYLPTFWAYNDFICLWKNEENEVSFFLQPVAYPAQDTIYHYHVDNSVLKPDFTVNYPDKENVKQHFNYETPSYYYIIYMEPVEVSKMFSVGWGNFPGERVIIDKKTLKGCKVRFCLDNHGWLDISDGRSWILNGYFTLNLTPDKLMSMIEKQLKQKNITEENRKTLRDLYDSIGEDDNNYVVFGKVK